MNLTEVQNGDARPPSLESEKRPKLNVELQTLQRRASIRQQLASVSSVGSVVNSPKSLWATESDEGDEKMPSSPEQTTQKRSKSLHLSRASGVSGTSFYRNKSTNRSRRSLVSPDGGGPLRRGSVVSAYSGAGGVRRGRRGSMEVMAQASDRTMAEWKKSRQASLGGEEDSSEVMGVQSKKVSTGRVLNPRSNFMRKWDMYVASLLVWVATITAFDTAFLETKLDALFFINRLIDLSFFIDLCMQFTLAYYDERTNQWVYDHGRIVTRYLRGWFCIDVVSTFPFDVVTLIVGGDDVDNLAVLRIVRLLKLAKLLRVLRAGRIFRRLETGVDIDYTQMEMLRFFFMILIFAHWMGCGWRLIIDVEGTAEEANWLNEAFPNDLSPSEDRKASSLYLECIYFAISHMIGFGTQFPVTQGEKAYSIFCMVFGAFVFGYIIGSVASVIASRDAKRNRYYHMMKELSHFMSESKFPTALKTKLREYFRYINTSDSVSSYMHLLRFMSPRLRGEVARLMDNNWIERVPVFRHCPNSFVVQIALALEQMTYPPTEPVFEVGDNNDRMYIIKKGVIAMHGRVFVLGMVMCMDALFRENQMHFSAAHTMAFSVVYSIHRDVVIDLCKEHPKVADRMRKLSLKRVFRDEIWAFVNAYKRHIGDPPIKKGSNFWGLGGEIDARELHYMSRFHYVYPLIEIDRERFYHAASTIQRGFRAWMLRRDELEQLELINPAFWAPPPMSQAAADVAPVPPVPPVPAAPATPTFASAPAKVFSFDFEARELLKGGDSEGSAVFAGGGQAGQAGQVEKLEMQLGEARNEVKELKALQKETKEAVDMLTRHLMGTSGRQPTPGGSGGRRPTPTSHWLDVPRMSLDVPRMSNMRRSEGQDYPRFPPMNVLRGNSPGRSSRGYRSRVSAASSAYPQLTSSLDLGGGGLGGFQTNPYI